MTRKRWKTPIFVCDMFGLYTQTERFFNDICDEIRLFYAEREIALLGEEDSFGEKVLRHFFSVSDEMTSKAELYENGKLLGEAMLKAPLPQGADELLTKKLQKRLVKQSVYALLKRVTGKRPPWGSLTGIRPTKLARESIEELGGVEAMRLFLEEFDVSAEKTKLAFDIVGNQLPYIDVPQNAIDLYVGIPFCVSRCKYCSFVSQDIARSAKFKAAYLEQLNWELRAAAPILQGYRVRAVYIGGGTPTALEAGELDSLMQTVGEVAGVPMEYTVEAGRPDTVTAEKLNVIKRQGARRISINAQTTKQQTLDMIGRKHSVQQFFEAFTMAREAGFEDINTDIILGLPGEDMADVARTIGEVAALSPENITVHTLALKRSSAFAQEQEGSFHAAEQISQMVERTHAMLGGQGYIPYYLYRQKYMSGNLENTGYARRGHICVYNIDHMEETTGIMAFGAGGISKRIFGAEQRIERAANVKDIEHYIARTAEMAERKASLFAP